MGLADVEGAETENRGFFADRTAVAENGLGALLEANVIVEAHRLEVLDQGMKDGVLFGDPFRGAGMGAEDDRQAVLFGDGVEAVNQIGEVTFGVDILFPVCGNDEVLALLKGEAG